MTLSVAHSQLLTESAIDLSVAEEAGVRSALSKSDLPSELPFREAVPGIVFPWSSLTGETVLQYRPDKPPTVNGKPGAKYVFPKGIPSPLWVHPRMLDTGAETVVIVEGTKQYLAAVSAAPDGVMLVGMAGCNGWSVGGVFKPGLGELPIDGSTVVLVLDADLATNHNVWIAAERLGKVCRTLGAGDVRFASLPAGDKAGLDDWLAPVPESRRSKAFAMVLDDSTSKLPKRPAKPKPLPVETDPVAELFDRNGLRVLAAVDSVRQDRYHALGPDGSVWTYKPSLGIYEDDEHALVTATREALGDRWRQTHHNNMITLLAAELAAEDRRLPAVPFGSLVAVTNGMLDPLTGELHPHDPAHVAYARLSVEWDPKAQCPRFDDWIADRCGMQADDLLEAVGLVLTPHAGQRKVPFLIGPTRSGKGTFLRILEGVVGDRHRSACTLHDLAQNRFASAGLVGSVLNSAGDLSDRHIDDLAMFKSITGDDTVQVERKFRDAFTFRNYALFVFSANTPPTVAETSRAYAARMRPYLFPGSYENHEDPAIERGLLEELPGVLVRLVEGVQRWHRRGGYAPVNPIVADLFARQSDPVAMFVAEVLEAVEDSFVATTDLHSTFSTWAETNRRSPMGRTKFFARVDNTLGSRKREYTDGTGRTGWRGWKIRPEADWSDESTSYALAEPHIRAVSAASAASVLLTPREEREQSDVVDDVVLSRGKIGTDPAEAADAHRVPLETAIGRDAPTTLDGFSDHPEPCMNDGCNEPRSSFAGGRCHNCAANRYSGSVATSP